MAQVMEPQAAQPGRGDRGSPRPPEEVVRDRFSVTVDNEPIVPASPFVRDRPIRDRDVLGGAKGERNAVALTLERLPGFVRVVAPATVVTLGFGRRVADHDVARERSRGQDRQIRTIGGGANDGDLIRRRSS